MCSFLMIIYTWSCRTEIKRSDSLNPYGILNPCGLNIYFYNLFLLFKLCFFYPNFLRSCTSAWKKQRPNKSLSQTTSFPSSILVKKFDSHIGAFKYDCNIFIRRPVGGSLVNSINNHLISLQ